MNRIIGYCGYCRDPIGSNEKFVVEDGNIYHKECYEQKETYYDPLEVDSE